MSDSSFLEQIKKEIDKVVDIPPGRRETDVTVKDIREMYNVSDKKAKQIMMEVAEKSDDYTFVEVLDYFPKRKIFALRKVNHTQSVSS